MSLVVMGRHEEASHIFCIDQSIMRPARLSDSPGNMILRTVSRPHAELPREPGKLPRGCLEIS